MKPGDEEAVGHSKAIEEVVVETAVLCARSQAHLAYLHSSIVRTKQQLLEATRALVEAGIIVPGSTPLFIPAEGTSTDQETSV